MFFFVKFAVIIPWKWNSYSFFFLISVEVKGSGRIKAWVNAVGQYKEVIGFDCPSVCEL